MTFRAVLSIKAMLEARIVEASTHLPVALARVMSEVETMAKGKAFSLFKRYARSGKKFCSPFTCVFGTKLYRRRGGAFLGDCLCFFRQ